MALWALRRRTAALLSDCQHFAFPGLDCPAWLRERAKENSISYVMDPRARACFAFSVLLLAATDGKNDKQGYCLLQSVETSERAVSC